MIAQEAIDIGPDAWSQDQIDRERFLIIENLVQKILASHGELLWDGFRASAPSEWKVVGNQYS